VEENKAMQIFKSKRSMLILVTLASIIAFGVTTALAQEKVKVKFKAFAVVTKKEKLKVDDTEGHFVSLYESKGVTSDGKFVRYFTSRSDLIKGNGTLSGYGKYVDIKDGDYYFSKYQGPAIATKSPEGKLKITFKGTYSYINGTGKFENIQGGGTFKGESIGKGIIFVDVEGEYVIKK
jgi:hypothetical protein